MLASAIVSAIAMVVIAGVTCYYAKKTRDLWEQNKKLWELSRDAALCSYAADYLASFIQEAREAGFRGVYTRTARKIIYDALDELLSPETVDKVGKFRSNVSAELATKFPVMKEKIGKKDQEKCPKGN